MLLVIKRLYKVLPEGYAGSEVTFEFLLKGEQVRFERLKGKVTSVYKRDLGNFKYDEIIITKAPNTQLDYEFV